MNDKPIHPAKLPPPRGLQKLLAHHSFPLVVQIVLLIVFILIILGGWQISTTDAEFAKELRNTNLANLLAWSYWWPLIIVATIFIGRIWCMVCPMELITAVGSKIGLKIKAPRFFRSGWVITIFFALILLIGIHTFAIHRLPHRMAIYMLILLLAALAVSLIFEKRTFCSYVCPVGHLLGLYALFSPFIWKVRDKALCRSCKTKDCVIKNNHYRLIGRSCTSNLFPATIADNRDCLLCTQCLKACPYDNPTFSLRKPFTDLFQKITLKSAQIAFVLMVAGFVVYEILSEWSSSKAVLTWMPHQVVKAFSITAPWDGLVSAIIMFGVFPAVFLVLVFALSRTGAKISLGNLAGMLALLLLPTMAAAHIFKSLLKTVSRIPYWPYVFSDPQGVATAERITDKTLSLDKSLPNTLAPVITIVAVLLLITALVVTFRIFRKSPLLNNLNNKVRLALAAGILAYWSIFAITIAFWRL